MLEQATDAGEDEMYRPPDTGIGAVAGTKATGAGIHSKVADRGTVHDHADGRRPRGRLNAEQVELVRKRCRCRSRDDGQLGQFTPGQHATIGNRLDRQLAEQRRHRAQRAGGICDARQHLLNARLCRQNQRQSVAKAGVRQLLLRAVPVRVVRENQGFVGADKHDVVTAVV